MRQQVHIATVGTSAITNRCAVGEARYDLITADPKRFGTRARLGWGLPRAAVTDDEPTRWLHASVTDHQYHLTQFARVAGQDEAAAIAALGGTTAELASMALARHQRGTLGNVVLLASDTPAGRLAATIVAEVARSVWTSDRFEFQTCAGLNPERPDDFFSVGLANVRSAAKNVIAANPGAEHTLNITGGFKGAIPFLTLLAIELGIDLIYLFERSGSLTRIDGHTLAEELAAGRSVVGPSRLTTTYRV